MPRGPVYNACLSGSSSTAWIGVCPSPVQGNWQLCLWCKISASSVPLIATSSCRVTDESVARMVSFPANFWGGCPVCVSTSRVTIAPAVSCSCQVTAFVTLLGLTREAADPCRCLCGITGFRMYCRCSIETLIAEPFFSFCISSRCLFKAGVTSTTAYP